jgi:hypothetical protein
MSVHRAETDFWEICRVGGRIYKIYNICVIYNIRVKREITWKVWTGLIFLRVGTRVRALMGTVMNPNEWYTVVRFAEALRYKAGGRGFDSRWCHWNFSLTSFRPHYGSEIDSASNRNEYQEFFVGGKGGRCVGLTT